MTSRDEIAVLESLLTQARRKASEAHTATLDTITPGDLVQLRPGADPTWETSIVLVHKVDARHVRGAILRPHRSGCLEAWQPYTHAEVIRIGRVPFPEPAADIRSCTYEPPCMRQLRKPAASQREAGVTYRSQRATTFKKMREEGAKAMTPTRRSPKIVKCQATGCTNDVDRPTDYVCRQCIIKLLRRMDADARRDLSQDLARTRTGRAILRAAAKEPPTC
jgi:hypothetical protein